MLKRILIRRTENPAIPREAVSRSGAGPVCSIPEFERALTRHYARSDRTGRHFTLMIMDLRKLSHSQRWTVAEAAGKRVRATDQIGWLDGTARLGAILYNCRNEPAARLAGMVCRDAGINAEDIATALYVYPDEVPAGLEALVPERKPANES